MDSVVNKVALNYNDVEIPEDWLADYKILKYENDTARRRRREKKIIVKIDDNYREEIKISELEEQDLVIYKLLDEKQHNIWALKELIGTRRSLKDYCRDKYGITRRDRRGRNTTSPLKRIMFISVAKTNFKQIQDLPNLLHVTQIHGNYVFQKMFRDFGAAIKIARSRYINLKLCNISKYYNDKINILNRFKGENYSSHVTDNTDSILRICEERNLHNYEIESILEEISKVRDTLDIVNYLEHDTPLKYKQQIFKNMKVTKLNENLYSTKQLSNEQEETIDDSQEDRC